MRVRIVVADRAEARFYDIERRDAALKSAGRMTDPQAHLHNRDFNSDRPGRVYDRAPDRERRGGVAHHATGGERTPKKHEAELFARRIVDELDRAHQQGRFERLVLMAAPAFLGELRELIPKSLRASVVLQIPKDLVHQDEAAISTQLTPAVFAAQATPA